MIKERITGSKKNLKWIRNRMMRDPEINNLRIFEAYPDKEADGKYYMFARYDRIIRMKCR